MLLNSRGRIVEDLFLLKRADQVMLECDQVGKDNFCKLLKRYVMHKAVSIEPSECNVYFVDSNHGGGGMSDPRVPSFGSRVYCLKVPGKEVNQT